MTNNILGEVKTLKQIKKHYKNFIITDEMARSPQGNQGDIKKCDICINFKHKKYYLEAKILTDDSTNGPNYSKQMIAEILWNRKNHGLMFKRYGLLLDYYECELSELITNYILKDVDKIDWMLYGLMTNSKKIFLYDCNAENLYYINWNDIYKLGKDNIRKDKYVKYIKKETKNDKT